ncbi:hypothetical protein EON66_04750 [archaeon]|nr:MAG: hypothetical protein EON66_04750 [archaeon]
MRRQAAAAVFCSTQQSPSLACLLAGRPAKSSVAGSHPLKEGVAVNSAAGRVHADDERARVSLGAALMNAYSTYVAASQKQAGRHRETVAHAPHHPACPRTNRYNFAGCYLYR